MEEKEKIICPFCGNEMLWMSDNDNEDDNTIELSYLCSYCDASAVFKKNIYDE